MSQLSQSDKARSNWWYYRIVLGLVVLSFAFSFGRMYQLQAQLNRELEASVEAIRAEKLLGENECTVLVDRIAARMEIGMPLHPVVVTQRYDSELSEKAIPLLLANLKDKRSAVVDHALTDLAMLLSRDENADRWKADLQVALLPMFECRPRDQKLVEILLLARVDHEIIRRRLLEEVDYDDIGTVLHTGAVMRMTSIKLNLDFDPLPLYVSYLRQRDFAAMQIVRVIEMDIGLEERSMKERFFSVLQKEMLEVKTPEEQARLEVWLNYVKDPSTLPEKYQSYSGSHRGPF